MKCDVKVCPAGHKKPQLCGRPYWLSDFWASACNVLKKNRGNEKAAAALVLLNQSRLVQEEAVASREEDFKRDLEDQPIVLTSKVKKALGITGLIGAAGGATVAGAAIGATIGALCIGVVSFGPAAGAGLVIGGVIGAAVGHAVGGTIVGLYLRHKEKKLAKAAAVAPTVTPVETPAETPVVTTAMVPTKAPPKTDHLALVEY